MTNCKGFFVDNITFYVTVTTNTGPVPVLPTQGFRSLRLQRVFKPGTRSSPQFFCVYGMAYDNVGLIELN